MTELSNSIGDTRTSGSNSVDKVNTKTLPTVAVAESLTCGMLASTIGDFSGVSKWFRGGVVTYSNEAKIKLLKTDETETMNMNGVSKNIAKQMAKGVCELLDADIGISTTGYAEKYYDTVSSQYFKPVAYIAMYNRKTNEYKTCRMGDVNLTRNLFRKEIVDFIITHFLSGHITIKLDDQIIWSP